MIKEDRIYKEQQENRLATIHSHLYHNSQARKAQELVEDNND